MLVLAVGVREAARQMELDEDTVKSWSRRGNWLAACKPTPAKHELPPTIRPVTLAPNAPTAADALANVLSDRHKRTKLGLSAWAVNASEHAASLDPEEALAAAPSVKAVADVAGKVWPEQGQQSIRLSIYGQQSPVLDVEMDVEQISTDVEQA